ALAVQHPKGGAADDRVLGVRGDVVIIGQGREADFEVLRVGNDACARSRGVHVDGAFTRIELGRRVWATHRATILVETGIGPRLEAFPVFDLYRAVEGDLGAEAAKTVFQRAERLVMNGREVFGLDPGDPS